MAENRSMTMAEVVAKTLMDEHHDFLKEAVGVVAGQLMEAEISTEIGAGRGEVSSERQTHRNGYRLGRPGLVRSTCSFRASARARPTSRRFWSRAARQSRRSSRS